MPPRWAVVAEGCDLSQDRPQTYPRDLPSQVSGDRASDRSSRFWGFRHFLSLILPRGRPHCLEARRRRPTQSSEPSARIASTRRLWAISLACFRESLNSVANLLRLTRSASRTSFHRACFFERQKAGRGGACHLCWWSDSKRHSRTAKLASRLLTMS